ncbi:MAG TPA: zinc ribbon domain-containing protein [Thermoanaerobaculaceae bacterium]|nr:zinc ribbon domain-containing protein [Thermoanaerobaculaceae bacterium]
MARIEFTDNYQDLSTDTGYQFKFYCESCGNGYMSSWQASKSGMAGEVMRAAGNILGGLFGRASAGAYEIQKAVGGPEHDHALEAAVTEIRPLFVQCKRCGKWVCQQICWNAERALCKSCAPILQRELAAKQAEIAVQQAEERMRQRDLLQGVDVEAPAVVQCPHCQAETAPGKFCSECGGKLAARSECPRCGAQVAEKARFCPECGQKMS